MAKIQSKAAIVQKLLSRGKGASLIEIGKATGWQPHSCRAFLTGVRKTDTLVKEQRADSGVAYRLIGTPRTPAGEGTEPIKDPVDPNTNVEETTAAEAASQ